jgi:AraC-like DNA-binding protein
MQHFQNISSFNSYAGLAKPLNNNIDVGYYSDKRLLHSEPVTIGFYRISIKSNLINEFAPDYEAQNPQPIRGVFFMSPDYPLSWKSNKDFTGMYIQFSKEIIEQNRDLFYNYLGYGEHEALLITNEEEKELKTIFDLLYAAYVKQKEQSILLSYIHLLITHIESFYHRQFSRDSVRYNHIVTEFQRLLKSYYDNDDVSELPTVQCFADEMKLSPNYLGDIIKYFTKKSAIETIHETVIEKAKSLLEEGNLNSSEVAYSLGFEYPNYFAKFFKKHTQQTPKEYKEAHKNQPQKSRKSIYQ